MTLDKNFNYIVSGIERSGTSMLMQIINSGEIPIQFDDSRSADRHNPKGYFELEGGKIINKVMNGSFPFNDYKGKFIKITAFGLQFLPPGNYKILYSERYIEEVLDSMEEMIGKKDKTRKKTKDSFIRLNKMVKKTLRNRKDVDFLIVNYNEALKNPKETIAKIIKFLDLDDSLLDKMTRAIDKKLYHQKGL